MQMFAVLIMGGVIRLSLNGYSQFKFWDLSELTLQLCKMCTFSCAYAHVSLSNLHLYMITTVCSVGLLFCARISYSFGHSFV